MQVHELINHNGTLTVSYIDGQSNYLSAIPFISATFVIFHQVFDCIQFALMNLIYDQFFVGDTGKYVSLTTQ